MSSNYFEKVPSPILDVPKPVIGIIASYLKAPDRARFARTCKRHIMFAPGEQYMRKLIDQKKKLAELLINTAYKYDTRLCDVCHKFGKNNLSCRSCDVVACSDCFEDGHCKFCISNIECKLCSENNANMNCFCCKHPICEYCGNEFVSGVLICSSCEKFNQREILAIYNEFIKIFKQEAFFESNNLSTCRICHKSLYIPSTCITCGLEMCHDCERNYNCAYCEFTMECDCKLNAFAECFYCNSSICQIHANILIDDIYMCSKCEI